MGRLFGTDSIPADSTTMAMSSERPRMAAEIAEAFVVAEDGGYKFAQNAKEIAMRMGETEDETGRSTRNGFKEMFPEEALAAKEQGWETEHIGSESGIWTATIPIKGKPSTNDFITKFIGARQKFLQENEDGLRKIYEQNKTDKTPFKFEQRNEDPYREQWLKMLGKHKEDQTGKEYIELGVQFRDGKFVKRDTKEMSTILRFNGIPQDTRSMFEVVTTTPSELREKRDFKNTANNQPFVKILIVEKSEVRDGKYEKYIDTIEFMFPHATTNGKPGIDFIEKIFESTGLEGEDRPIPRNQILRKADVKTKEGKRFPIYETRISYKITPEEEEFNNILKTAAGTTTMGNSVVSNMTWVGSLNEKSGFVCVDPDDATISNIKNDKQTPKAPPAGLQVALIVSPAGLNKFLASFREKANRFEYGFIRNLDDFKNVCIEMARETSINHSLKPAAESAKKQMRQARKGMSSPLFYWAHTKERSKFLLRTAMKKEARIIGEAPVITSFVTTKIPGLVFTSSLNLNADVSDAKVTTPTGDNWSTKIRTTPEEVADIMLNLSKSGQTVPVWKVEDGVRTLNSKKVKNKRIAVVIMGLNVILNNPTIAQEVKDQYQAKAFQAYKTIMMEDLIG